MHDALLIAGVVGFRDFLVGRGLSMWNSKEHYRQVKRNADLEEISAEPSLLDLHKLAARCLERELSASEERSIDLAYSDGLPTDRANVVVHGYRFEENWMDFLRKSTVGDGPTILERLVTRDGRFGSQQQLVAEINHIPLAGMRGMHTSEQHSIFMRAYAKFKQPGKPPSDKQLFDEYCRQVHLEADAQFLAGKVSCAQEAVDSLLVLQHALIAHKDKHIKLLKVRHEWIMQYAVCIPLENRQS
jgi:hypothetical protein